MQRWARPGVTLALHQQMPDHDGEFACGRDGGDVLAAPGPHAQKEGPQRSGSTSGRPCRLDEHAARMTATLLGDPPMVCWTWARLADARVQPEITHELLRLVEARHVADRRLHRQRDGHVDAGNEHLERSKSPLSPCGLHLVIRES